MERVGIRDKFVETGEVPDLFVKYQVQPEDIAAAVRRVIARKKGQA
jgi:transketolase C-terminal domain/subunit